MDTPGLLESQTNLNHFEESFIDKVKSSNVIIWLLDG